MKDYSLIIFSNSTAILYFLSRDGAICNNGNIGPYKSSSELMTHLKEEYPNANIYYGSDFKSTHEDSFSEFIERAWVSRVK